jgi:hypothetical protein
MIKEVGKCTYPCTQLKNWDSISLEKGENATLLKKLPSIKKIKLHEKVWENGQLEENV